ncbi:acyl-CoA dehydrogenase family protein [Streptomyces endophyticus]|uniref:Flavin-dependent monooxygenase n=1 Tax=Streptomyces endophyticus TaxID=714166 RepID=A0ABU6F5Q5_9ACTN|nr:acyl-CoA dehydrogenase family protein [Streptomyces endophyticus]MEB8339353.1 flavin-dependent monooxygenase [Streptomyces endophyticus]
MGDAPEPIAGAKWQAVLAELTERRAEFNAQGYVPRDFIEKLMPFGVYRHATPIRFGGSVLPPHRFLRLVEEVGRIDGSTAWVVGFASANTYLGALPVGTQKEIYRDGPDVVVAGGLFPMQRAERTKNGFRVSGRWKFASGCMAADYINVGLLDESAGGQPRAALLPADQVTIVQDWDVSGMRASGSFDTVIDDVEIPLEWTYIRGGASRIDEPLFRYPLLAYQAQCHAAIGLGVALGALDHAQHSGSYRGITGAPPVGERAYYRTEFARAYVALQSARRYFLDVAEEVWETVSAGEEASAEQVARSRLSAVHIADTAAQVVHDLSKVSGAAIIQNSHPLNRIRLDAQVPQLHASLSQHIYDDAGAVLLGLDPTTPGFLGPADPRGDRDRSRSSNTEEKTP